MKWTLSCGHAVKLALHQRFPVFCMRCHLEKKQAAKAAMKEARHEP